MIILSQASRSLIAIYTQTSSAAPQMREQEKSSS